MPPHGTRARYLRGCHCEPCTTANRDYLRARRRKIAYGRWSPFVEADEAREHVAALLASGMSLTAIEDLAGVARTEVIRIAHGQQKRLRADIVQRVFAVQTVSNETVRYVGSPRYRSMVEELRAAGYSIRSLERRIGNRNLYHLHLHTRMKGTTAALIQQLHDDLYRQDPAVRLACRCKATRSATNTRATLDAAPLRAAIRRYLDDRCVPIDDFASDFHLSAETLRQLLHGRERVSVALADRICSVLGLHVFDLWPDWFEEEVSA